ncbi:hypothetical protein K2X85_12945 [bacterium]|nr:hypothetical protein [bacterium]
MDRLSLAEAILGYLELSDGTPSLPFQRAVIDLFGILEQNSKEAGLSAWLGLRAELMSAAETTRRLGSLDRARQIIRLVHDGVLPSYRRHHEDLLAHLTEADLFTPFFLIRAYEESLKLGFELGQPIDQLSQRVVHALNDFIGHRPVAVLENRQAAQPYSHERVCPIPIYRRGVGVDGGAYASLLQKTLAILQSAPVSILESASMDLDVLDELALDPRAYDHGHPVNQRPGYQFGEWDPDTIDNRGRYRRFVLRRMILQALVDWIARFDEPRADAEHEAAAALAGTMLLASGISGDGPNTFSSEVSLATLVPKVAAYRDEFYRHLLDHEKGPRGQRLREEALRLRQPFGGVRSSLNQFVSRQRAEQLQRDRLSLLFARMGYTEASRAQAARIDVTSTRMRAQIECLIESSRHFALSGDVVAATDRMIEAELLLYRAIECGAMVDPWNILGFQGNFHRFASVEDSVVDSRVDILLATVQSIFDGYALAQREAAVIGHEATLIRLDERWEPLVQWWDRFATVEVSGVRRVSGAESRSAARFVAQALAEWRLGGTRTGDVAFWRERASSFTSTQSFGLVVRALMEKEDALSSMALLMQWLSVVDQAPLDHAGHSFHDLSLRWMARVVGYAASKEPMPSRSGGVPLNPADLATKFLDYIEANAEELWNVPHLPEGGRSLAEGSDSQELFSAAYEGMTYRDQTDDGVEGSLAGQESPASSESISEAEQLMRRLRFIGTVARLWYLASQKVVFEGKDRVAKLASWIERATRNKADLRLLLIRLEKRVITLPSGTRDSLIEFERQSSIRETLVAKTIYITMETSHALRAMTALHAALGGKEDFAALAHPWEPTMARFESQARFGDQTIARQMLPDFMEAVSQAPLMYVSADKGGRPSEIGPARYAREAIRMLVGLFPLIGEFRGTRDLLDAILLAEQQQSFRGTQVQVSEFDTVFRDVFEKVMIRLARLLADWEQTRENDLLAMSVVNRVVEHFSVIWTRHTSLVRISEVETLRTKRSWQEFRSFVKKYGRDWFTQAFLSEANLGGVLRQGPSEYLQQQIDDADGPEISIGRAIRSGKMTMESAAHHLGLIARVILENYDEYRDYNTTTPQSDYGDNLHLLVDLIAHKIEFERHRWGQEPSYIAHSVLLKEGRFGLAAMVREDFDRRTTLASRSLLTQLEATEEKCGFRLQSIRGRLAEGFVGPLRLDEVLALAEKSLPPRGVERPRAADEKQAFASLVEALDEWTSQQHGAGIEVPEWLRRLEACVDNSLDAREDRVLDYEDLIPAVNEPAPVSYEEFMGPLDGLGDDVGPADEPLPK